MIKINKINCIVAVFEDDEVLLEALKKARAAGLKILDCFTPFPVHGIEKILGIKRSNLGGLSTRNASNIDRPNTDRTFDSLVLNNRGVFR